MVDSTISKQFLVVDRAQGSPERLKLELEKLKSNNYQTMPSFERLPETFYKYYTWLEKTQTTQLIIIQTENNLK
jgi:hypothetical protein